MYSTDAPDQAASPSTRGIIDPLVPALCLGLSAAQNLLGTNSTMGRLRGKVHKYRDVPVVCTYHPAALLRNEAWKKDTWEDMKLLLRTMGRPVPGAKS